MTPPLLYIQKTGIETVKLPPFSAMYTAPISSPATSARLPTANDRTLLYIEQWIHDLSDSNLRENAIYELSKVYDKLPKKRDGFQELAIWLWHSFGTIAVLLQEIISIYPFLSPPTLTSEQSTRACNALTLFQCVASHPETRMLFIQAHIPLYLYPFLNTNSKHRSFEYLRLTSLGVIGALVKVDDPKIISFLLSSEIIPLCLKTMDMGNELSKTVSTFIVHKILMDDLGLRYICTTADRFYALCAVLGNMVSSPTDPPTLRLLRHIIRCYLRLSDYPKACEALNTCLPEKLRDATFSDFYHQDPTMTRWLQQLLHKIQAQQIGHQGGVGF